MNSDLNNQIPTKDDVFLKQNYHLKDRYFVEEVYNTYLKITQPKKKDINIFIEQLEESEITREQLLKSIRNLPEFKQLWKIEDSNRVFKLTDVAFLQKTFILKVEDFVVEVYRTYLKREPDKDGKNSYIKDIRDNRITRQDFLEVIRRSQEFNNFWKVEEEELLNENEVKEISSNLAEIQAKTKISSEDFLRNSGVLDSYLATIENIHPKKIKDQEFLDFTYNLNDEDFLKCLYKVYLKRNLDPTGKIGWSKFLINEKFRRALLLNDLKRSDEFKEKWHSFMDNLIINFLPQIKKCKRNYLDIVYGFFNRL